MQTFKKKDSGTEFHFESTKELVQFVLRTKGNFKLMIKTVTTETFLSVNKQAFANMMETVPFGTYYIDTVIEGGSYFISELHHAQFEPSTRIEA